MIPLGQSQIDEAFCFLHEFAAYIAPLCVTATEPVSLLMMDIPYPRGE